MKTSSLCSLLAGLALLAPGAPAQTVTWVAVAGPGSLTASWNDPANWSTGTVPNGPGATAALTAPGPRQLFRNNPDFGGAPYDYSFFSGYGSSSAPGGALPVITGDISVGTLRFGLFPGFVVSHALYVGAPDLSATGRLRIEGPGIFTSSGDIPSADLNVLPGSTLTLAQDAVVLSSDFSRLFVRLYGAAGNPATLRLEGNARFDTAPTGTRARGEITGLGPVVIEFNGRSGAGNATFDLPAGASIAFYGRSDADSATFRLRTGSQLLFTGDTTAGTADISFLDASPVPNTSIVRFAGNATAGAATFRANAVHGGAVEFVEQATGGSANLGPIRRLDISGAEKGTGSTGRQRAGTSTLAPASVVAGDTRTITLGNVAVRDLLLGSNTLQLTGGSLYNIRDSGGAYLSAAGENLVGGGLLKTGPGTLFLYGPTYAAAPPFLPSYNSFNGLTTIREGTVIFYNRLASVNVEAGGILNNQGYLAYVEGLLHNAGTVQPRFDIAPESALRVTGNYTQTAAGRLHIDAVNGPGYYGRLDVSGTATLAGRLDILASASFFPNRAPGSATLDIIRAGQVSGRFDTVTSWFRVKPTLDYRADRVVLQLELLPIAALGTTPGQQAFGAYLDALHQAPSGSSFPNNYRAIEDGLNSVGTVEKFQAILDNFSPDRYSPVVEHGFVTAAARAAMLDRQFTAGRTGSDRGLTAFLEGGRRESGHSAIAGLPETRATASGGLGGLFWRNENFLLGAYFARETSRLDLDAAGSRADIRSTEPGLFAQYARGRWFVNASAAVSRDDYQLRRTVDYVFFSPLVVTDTAAPSGRRTDVGLTMGYAFTHRGWTATPFAGVLASRWTIDDFTETNSTAYHMEPLAISGWSSRSVRGRAGFSLTRHAPGRRFQPELTVAWLHEFDDDRSIPAGLVGAPSAYLAPGRPAETDLVQASLSASLRVGRAAALYGSVGGAWGRDYRLNSDLSAGVRCSF